MKYKRNYFIKIIIFYHMTEVVFDYNWKTALIASIVSDFLRKKATLQQEEQSSRNVIIYLYLEYDKVESSRRSEWINPRVSLEHLGFSGKLHQCSFPKVQLWHTCFLLGKQIFSVPSILSEICLIALSEMCPSQQ